MPSIREEITKAFLRISRRGSVGHISGTARDTVWQPIPREGRQFGAYRILKRLGAGGMGEVYLAFDARLERQVALKFLPPHLMSDDAAVRRFQHEARAASGLNHPNILTIHEVGQIEGEFFIASEYVDGVTLRTAIYRESVDLAGALDIAIQVSSALTAAHSAGVVHRDLKPGNIMIRPDGYVKVIDFGLAKLVQGSDRESPIEETKTLAGSVIGTLDYMSPEQARGDKLDHRTDLWSLGVVLYEMVAQRRPFQGDTESHVIVGILDHPVPPIESAHRLPARLTQIIHRALEKDRAKRYQTAREMLTDLQQVSEGSGLRKSIRPSIFHEPSRARAGRGIAFGVGSVVLLLAWGVWWWGFHGKDILLGPNWFEFESTKRITFDGNVDSAAISPDAKYLAYVTGAAGDQVLRLRLLETRSEGQLPITKDRYIGLTFSPDGRSLYYVLRDPQKEFGRLFTTDVESFGSTPSSMILEDVDGPVSFSPDGRRFAFLRHFEQRDANGDSIVVGEESNPRDGRAVVRLTSTEIQGRLAWLSNDSIAAVVFPARLSKATQPVVSVFSTDGRLKRQFSSSDLRILALPVAVDGGSLLLFTGLPQGAEQKHLIQLFIPTGKFHEVASDILGLDSISATSDSRTVAAVKIYQRSSIWSADVSDLSAGRKLMPDVENISSFSWSDNGEVVFPSARSGNVNLARLDQSGTVSPLGKPERCVESQPAAAPGQEMVVYASNCAHGGDDFNLWRLSLRTGKRVQLTNGSNYDYQPDVSPDGKWVAFTSWASNISSIWKIPTAGGIPVRLSPDQARYPFFSPDGKQIVCQIRQAVASWRVAILSAFDGTIERQFPQLPVTDAARWSPDGTALDYVDVQNGASNIWRQSLSGGPAQQLTHFGEDKIIHFAWSRDGTKLAYVRGRAESDAVLFHRAGR